METAKSHGAVEICSSTLNTRSTPCLTINRAVCDLEFAATITRSELWYPKLRLAEAGRSDSRRSKGEMLYKGKQRLPVPVGRRDRADGEYDFHGVVIPRFMPDKLAAKKK